MIPVTLTGRLCMNHFDHGAMCDGQGGSRFANPVEPPGFVEASIHTHRTAGCHCGKHTHELTGDMEEWMHHVKAIVRGHLALLKCDPCKKCNLRMRHQHGLRRAGRAGCKDDRGYV
nr:hypothetical protein [Limimaricola cinnabarinus]